MEPFVSNTLFSSPSLDHLVQSLQQTEGSLFDWKILHEISNQNVIIPPNFMSTPVSWRRRASIVASRAHRAAFIDGDPDARKFQTQTELCFIRTEVKDLTNWYQFCCRNSQYAPTWCPSVLQPAQLTLTTCPIPYSSLREAGLNNCFFSTWSSIMVAKAS
jgi:hypothetical protein